MDRRLVQPERLPLLRVGNLLDGDPPPNLDAAAIATATASGGSCSGTADGEGVQRGAPDADEPPHDAAAGLEALGRGRLLLEGAALGAAGPGPADGGRPAGFAADGVRAGGAPPPVGLGGGEGRGGRGPGGAAAAGAHCRCVWLRVLVLGAFCSLEKRAQDVSGFGCVGFGILRYRRLEKMLMERL